MPPDLSALRDLLLPYQRRWVRDPSPVKVAEKSRRVGLTWAEACDDVLAAADDADDTWYIGYSEDQGAEFIRDCAQWAHDLNLVSRVDEGNSGRVLVDENGDDLDPSVIDASGIQAFRLQLKNKRRITALSSRPRNLRGKKGRVVLDEYAFHDAQDELLKAAIALLMWGGSVRIISTHDGVENPFNRLVQDIRDRNARAAEGECDPHTYSLHTITLDDALEEGLYRRICQTQGKEWSPEAEQAWRAWLIDSYGMGAEEELFCVPSQMGAGDYFDRSNIPVLDSWAAVWESQPAATRVLRRVRPWDFAATRPSKANRDPDWTRGPYITELSSGKYVLSDLRSLRDGPAAVNELLVATARQDGVEVEQALAEDPGAAGKSDAEAKARALLGYQVHTIKWAKNKEAYARVWAPIVKRGDFLVIRGPWLEELLRELEAFPGGKHDDIVDAISLGFQVLLGAASWDGVSGCEGLGDERHPSSQTAAGRARRLLLGDDDDDDGDDGGRFGGL